jgi:LacI family transcriptional regulator
VEEKMAKKISMEDIGKHLGVSKNTVSLVLRGMPGINANTRELIINAAKELGYEYNSINKDKVENKDIKNICVILSKNTKNSVGFFNYVQFGIEAEAKKRGFNPIIYYYDEQKDSFETPISIQNGIISGIITLGRVSRVNIASIINYKLPVVMVDHYFENIKLDYILTDNVSGAYRATEYLISRGHKTISFLGNVNVSLSFYDRYEGYLRALRDNNLEPFKLMDKSMEELCSIDIDLVVNFFKNMKELPEAILCCNDAEAIAVTRALNIMNIKVPEEISIMGFDDIEFARSTSPELTTMRVEKEAMGKKAVTRLSQLIKEQNITGNKIDS